MFWGLFVGGVVALSGCITMGQLEEWNEESGGSGGSNAGCATEQVNAGTALGEVASGSTRGCRSNFSDCSTGSAPDVEVSWRAPYEGCFSFTTRGSSFDTKLLVFDGGGTLLECDDDGGGDTSSRVDLCLDNNAQLYVVVDGYGSSQGSYRLQVEADEGGSNGTADQGPDVGTPVAVSLETPSFGLMSLEAQAVVPCEGCTFSLSLSDLLLQTMDFRPSDGGGASSVYVYANDTYMGLGSVSSREASWYGYQTFYGMSWVGSASW